MTKLKQKFWLLTFVALASITGCEQSGDSESASLNANQTDNLSTTAVGFKAQNPVSTSFGLGFVMTPTMAVQPDGKILYAGGTGARGASVLTLARYKSNGTIDKSFGDDGYAFANYGTDSYLYGIAVQSDGKIVATGASYYNESIIIRFNEDGSLDSSFQAIIMSGNNNRGFYFPIIQTNGKIIATNQYNIYRFNADGTTDLSFGASGHTNSYVKSIALQSDQKIVACGATDTWNGAQWSNPFTTVLRLNSDGTADTSFGVSGTTPPPLFGANPCDTIAIQPDGKIIIGGNFWYATNSGDPNIANPHSVYVIRLNANGSIDSSFANNGIFIYSMPKATYSLSVSSILVLPDDSIFVAGSSGTIKLTSNGSIDPTYISPIVAEGQNGLAAAALAAPSGKIIMNWYWSGAGYIYSIKP